MGKRGRPKSPELLTPREQEVLDLIREGRTNPQIADQLGISIEGVKYHVSEILSKLDVSTREEAAAWRPERSWWGAVLSPLALLGRKSAWVLGGAAIVAACSGLALLAFLIVRARDSSSPLAVALAPTATATPGVRASEDGQFASIYFANDQLGWVAGVLSGGPGVILGTRDGGRIWTPQYTNAAAVISHLSFISPSLGWAIQTGIEQGAQSTILQTSDGQTWQPISSIEGPLKSLQMTSPTDGWALKWGSKDRPPQLLHTNDGGQTWAALAPPVDTSTICSSDPGILWAATTDGQILRSSDAGITWNRSFVAPEDLRRLNSNALSCHSGGLVWSSFNDGAGGGGVTYAVYRTLDGGANWDVVRSGRSPGPITIVGERTAYAATYCGPCSPTASTYRTTDGGLTWETLQVRPDLSLVLGFSCSDPDDCWLVGEKSGLTADKSPLILATSDGGQTWTQQYP